MIELKIHDVLHNELDEKPDSPEEYVKGYIRSGNVKDLRIEWGNSNSPIFIYLDVDHNRTIKDYKIIAREALRGFNALVGVSIDVEKTIKDDNIRIGKR
jgi:hypothetical protein